MIDVVVICESPTLNPAINIIIVGVIDEAKGPIILRRISVVVVVIIKVVFRIVTAVVILIVDCENSTLLSLTLNPVFRIIILGVIDKAKDPIIGGAGVLIRLLVPSSSCTSNSFFLLFLLSDSKRSCERLIFSGIFLDKK